MKILYVGNNQGAAQLAAGTLRAAGPDVTVTWAGRLSDAMSWVRTNQNLAAVIVEEQVQNQSCTWFVRQVRGLGLTWPIIVVAASGTTPVASLKAGADDYVTSGATFARQLPEVVGRLLRHAHDGVAQRGIRCLYVGDSTLARESLPKAQFGIEFIDPVRQPDGSFGPIPSVIAEAKEPFPFDLLLVEHGRQGSDIFAILKDVALRRLQVPIVFVVEWEEELIIPALRLGAIDYVVKTRDSFQALAFRLDRVLSPSSLLQEHTDPRATPKSALAARAVSEVSAALESAEEARVAAIERLTQREAELSAALFEASTARKVLEQKLSDAESSLQLFVQKTTVERQAAEDLASQRQTEFESRLEEEIALRRTFEQKLLHTAAVVRVATQRHASLKTTVDQLTDRQAEYDRQLAAATQSQEAQQQRLRDATVGLEQAQQALASKTAALADATSARDALQAQLRDAQAALERAQHHAASNKDASVRDASRRKSEFEAGLAREVTARQTIEKQLADMKAALQATSEWHATEMSTATARLAERQAQVDAHVRELERARADLTTATERFTGREQELTVALRETIAKRDDLERALGEADSELQRADRQAAEDRRTAGADISRRQAEFEARLDQEVSARNAAEQKLAYAEAALGDALKEHTSERNMTAAHLAAATEGFSARRQELDATLKEAAAQRDDLEQRIAKTEAALKRAEGRTIEERQVAAQEISRRQAEFEARLNQEVSARHASERQLADVETTFRNAVQQHAMEMSTAAAQLAEVTAARDDLGRRLTEAYKKGVKGDLGRRLSEAEAAAQKGAQFVAEHEAALHAADRRQSELEAQIRREVAARNEFEQKTADAERALQEALQRHSSELTTIAAHAAERQAKYESELAHFAAEEVARFSTEFDARLAQETARALEQRGERGPDDQDRVPAEMAEKIRQLEEEGEKLRGLVETSQQDLAELEEKLRSSQRMEAVGRLASEVAATCDSLLRDVSQGGHQWLATIDGDNPAIRQQGELLLKEVTRAATFLRQLEVYGKTQESSLGPVDITGVLHDLGSVLKRVAGDEIEFVFADTSSPMHAAVESERVERILVNVAAYGRERMPFGGRLTFELATVTVRPESVPEDSSLRPGAHILITVTGVSSALRWDGAITLREVRLGRDSGASKPDRPDVDLGALQTLIKDCGGHLWMAADPPGDMMLKIHLPQGAGAHAAERRTSVRRVKNGRSMGRWFRAIRH